jgi:hypothetical protein
MIDISLRKAEDRAIITGNGELDRRPRRANEERKAIGEGRRGDLKLEYTTSDSNWKCFYFFVRNLLKTQDSQKLMKANESNFPFILFHFLFFAAVSLREFAHQGCISRLPCRGEPSLRLGAGAGGRRLRAGQSRTCLSPPPEANQAGLRSNLGDLLKGLDWSGDPGGGRRLAARLARLGV